MARWTWIAATAAGVQQAELTVASGRTISWKLGAGATAKFSLDGRHILAPLIDELATDVIVLRDGVRLFRGRIGATSDTLDASTHKTSIDIADYRAILQRRIWWNATTTYTGIEQGTIAWNLISHTQGQTGGNLGITQGAGAVTGVTTTRTVEPGVIIGGELDTLAEAGDPSAGTGAGFDWEIAADLAFNIFYPSRGQSKPTVILEYGGSIESITRQVAPSAYANAVRVSGSAAGIAGTAVATDVGTRSEGRWDHQEGDTTILTSPAAAARAARILTDLDGLDPSYTCVLRAGWWEGPTHLFIGDTVPAVIRSGRLNVQTSLRVTELSVTLGESGEEKVSVTLGPTPTDLRLRLRESDRRLARLERR